MHIIFIFIACDLQEQEKNTHTHVHTYIHWSWCVHFAVYILLASWILAIFKVKRTPSTDCMGADPPSNPRGQVPLCCLSSLVSPAKANQKTETQRRIKREATSSASCFLVEHLRAFCFVLYSNHLQNNGLCQCVCVSLSRVCGGRCSSYGGAGDARWADRSFVTLQEHKSQFNVHSGFKHT